VTSPHQTWRVFLIGFMGAGKTSVGNVLARRLGWSFYDLDDVVEAREQQSIAHIFTRVGEASFRRIESSALMDLLENSEGHMVLALGGGAFVQPANRETLRRFGAVTFLLDAPLEELARRCQADNKIRPNALDRNRFEELFASRRPTYELAQFRVETSDKQIEEVAEEIETIIKNRVIAFADQQIF
jgi:shikimate kinase